MSARRTGSARRWQVFATTVTVVALGLALWWALSRNHEAPSSGGSIGSGDPDLDPPALLAAEGELPVPVSRSHAAQDDGRGAVDVVLAFEGGQPADGLGVTLRALAGQDDAAPRGRTDVRGWCRHGSLEPGPWRVEVDGWPPRREWVVDAVQGETVTIRIELSTQLHIAGYVVGASGQRVPGASVLLAPVAARGYETREVTVTDDLGRFRIRTGFDPVMLGARADGHVPSSMRRLTSANGAYLEGVLLTLGGRGGALAGTVVDPAGHPVPGALVRVGEGRLDSVRPVGDAAPAPPHQVVTDAAGAFLAVGLAPGERTVVVRAEGLAPWRGTCLIQEGQCMTCEVALRSGSIVHGVVRGPDGVPVAGCTVSTGDVGDLAYSREVTPLAGTYRFDGLAAGSHPVIARHRELGSAIVHAECVEGAETVADIQLDPGTLLRGRVVSQDDEPVSAIVHAAQYAPKIWGQVCVSRGSDGRFWIAKVPDGPIEVRVDGGNVINQTFSGIDAEEGEVVLRVTLRPPTSARIRGSVVMADGQIARFGEVSVRTYEGDRLVRVDTSPIHGASGTFELGPLHPARYKVRIECGGAPWYVSEWRDVLAHEVWDLGVVRLQAGGQLHVQLSPERPDGASISVWNDRGQWFGNLGREGSSMPLAAGEYVLRFFGEGLAESHKVVQVVAGETTAVPWQWQRGVACELRIRRGEYERDAERVLVEVARAGERGARRPLAFAQGESVVTERRWLAPGDYEMRVVRGAETLAFPVAVDSVEGVQVVAVDVAR